MKYLILTNTASDTLNLIKMDDLTAFELPLQLGESPVGPCGIDVFNDKVVVANNYSNSISLINLKDKKEKKNYYIGSRPNDIKNYRGNSYVVCGESNALLIFDLSLGKIDCEIKLGEYPQSINVSAINDLAYVTNMESNSLSIININEKSSLQEVSLEEYPTKIAKSYDGKYLYICESYIGKDKNGKIAIFSISENRIVGRVEVGITPSDVFDDGEYLYVSNLEEGSISIIKKSDLKIKGKIYIGGMLSAILKYENSIFALDYYNGLLKKINISGKKIKTIAVGKEPSAMILITQNP